MMKKRIASTILALCLLLPMLPVRVRAEDPTTGDCGTTASWRYDSATKTLFIEGSGDMANYDETNRPGYEPYIGEIEKLEIQGGITSIGDYAFSGCTEITRVTFPDSVKKIGEQSFSNCDNLSIVYFPTSLIGENNTIINISSNAFKDCTNLKNMFFAGQSGQWSETKIRNILQDTNPIYSNGNVNLILDVSDPVVTVFGVTGIPNNIAYDATELREIINSGIVEVILGADIDLGNETLEINHYYNHRTILDLNGHNIVSNASPVIDIQHGDLTVKDSTATTLPVVGNDNNVQYTSGCIHTNGKRSIAVKVQSRFFFESGTIKAGNIGISANGTTIISGGYVEATESAVALLSETTPTCLVIDGGVLLSNDNAALAGNGMPKYQRTDIYLNGGTLISKIKTPGYITCGIYHPQQGSIYIRGGDIRAEGGVGILMRGGSLCIGESGYDNVSVIYPKEEIKITVSGNTMGAVGDASLNVLAGQAIVMDQRSNYYSSKGISLDVYGEMKGKYDPPLAYPAEGFYLRNSNPDWGSSYYSFVEDQQADKVVNVTLKGGTGTTVLTVGADGKLTRLPTPPDKEGYTFKGWFTEADGGTEVTTDTPFTRSTTIYAHWEKIGETPVTFTVTFNSNGGSAVTGQTITSGGKVTKPEDPIKDDCTFGGWYKEESCTNAWDFDNDTVTENVTLYAKWTEKDPDNPVNPDNPDNPDDPQGYTITFDLNYTGAAAPTTATTGTDGKLASLPAPDPTRTGYTFDGWFSKAEGGTKITAGADGTVFEKNTTVYAHWTETGGGTEEGKAYTITFKLEYTGAEDIIKTTGKDGKLTDWPADPTRTDYTFDGWYTARLNGDKVSPDKEKVFDKDTTLYAHWTQDSGTDDDTSYRIYIPGSVSGGEYDVSHRSALRGTRVTIEFTPRSGYDLDYLTVTNRSTGEDVPLTERYSDEYYFTMPASSVDVDIAFYRERPGNVYFDAVPPQAKPGPTAWYYMNRHIWHVTDGMVPDSTPITRDMLVSVLYNLTDESLLNVPGTIGSKTDSAHAWAVSNGIMPDIYASGLWGTDKSLSREQLALMVFQYARYRGRGTYQSMDLAYYADGGQVRPIAQEAVSWSLACGLLNPLAGTAIIPRGTITCGQTGELLYRYQTTIA